MNASNVMNEPFYMPILAVIETRIAKADQSAEAQGMPFTDSQVRSILNKLRKQAEGGEPKIPAGNPREQALEAMYRDILDAREDFAIEYASGERRPLPAHNWVLALKTVEDSIRLRSSGTGSREYLEFIRLFVQKLPS